MRYRAVVYVACAACTRHTRVWIVYIDRHVHTMVYTFHFTYCLLSITRMHDTDAQYRYEIVVINTLMMLLLLLSITRMPDADTDARIEYIYEIWYTRYQPVPAVRLIPQTPNTSPDVGKSRMIQQENRSCNSTRHRWCWPCRCCCVCCAWR